MELEEYRPRPNLITKTTLIQKPRFPVIDAHNHLGDEFGGGWTHRPLSQLLEMLDEAGISLYVDLDGGWGEEILEEHLDAFKNHAPERFRVFGGVDWTKWAEKGKRFPEWAAGQLHEQARRGADGLKIWKGLGLSVRDEDGNLAGVDDSRLDIIWETAADLELPVMIHVADPVAFFQHLDEQNERWEELHAHPDWHFPSPSYPSFLSIVNALANLVERHPTTTFIGAHVGCYAENLAWVSALLDRCQNFYVDISARIGELGRQPYSARKFFLKHAGRILFGSDMGPYPEAYQVIYRFLETDDEYFNYNAADMPMQGRWYVNGLFLPDEVLEKVYNLNAARILGIDPPDKKIN
jgi:predicted TIM-barrel fold metal-dependent hydrolase